jgi:hypothetical protein
MYAPYRHDDDDDRQIGRVRIKAAHESGEERSDKANAVVTRHGAYIVENYPSAIAYDLTSAVMRSRGIPCLDRFTAQAIGSFRRGLGLPDRILNPNIRAFLKYRVIKHQDIKITFWVVEPVMATVQIGPADFSDLESARSLATIPNLIDPMGATSMGISLKDENLIGRLVPYAVSQMEINEPLRKFNFKMCTLSSSAFHITISKPNCLLMHLAMTFRTYELISQIFAEEFYMYSGTTLIMNMGITPKIEFIVSPKTGRSSVMRMYSHGGFHYGGSPKDIEQITKDVSTAIFETFRRVPNTFIKTMRVVTNVQIGKMTNDYEQ